MNVLEIKIVKDSNKYNEKEIELCCAIANRFTNGDLFSAAHEYNWYKRDTENQFMKNGVKAFIEEWFLNA